MIASDAWCIFSISSLLKTSILNFGWIERIFDFSSIIYPSYSFASDLILVAISIAWRSAAALQIESAAAFL
jgi:hypothetical protein